MNKLYALFVVFPVLFLVGACSSDSNTNTESSATTQIISTNGGDISSGDQRLTLDIPAGALASDTEIVIKKLTESEILEKYPNKTGTVDFVFELSPDGQQFINPVTVEYLLPTSVDRNTFRALFTVSNSVSENVQDVVYNSSTGVVTGTITHFSELVGLPIKTTVNYDKSFSIEVGETISITYDVVESIINMEHVDTYPKQLSNTSNIISVNLADRSTVFAPTTFTIDVTCNAPGTDSVLHRLEWNDSIIANTTGFPSAPIGGQVEFVTTIICNPTPTDEFLSVIDVGDAPEGVRIAGSPPYADGGTNQRFIVASADDVTVFENNGTVINTFERDSNKYGALYLQPSNPGNNTHYYAYGSTGGLACAEDGTPGTFCKLDFSFSSSPGSSNTTDAQCGRDANGLEQCDNFCRVQAGRVACASETLAGDTFDDPEDVFLGIAGLLPTSPLPIISYAPLSPTSGIAVTNDGYVMHIDTQTDIATDISSTAGTDVRSVACEQLDTGFGCVVQSFSDKQTTACGGTDATDFTCGSSVTTGEAVTVGLAKADNGNMVVIAPSFSDGNIYAIEFTPTFDVALQAEFFKTNYLQLYASQITFDFIGPGHAEIDPINDTISVSGNGSDNVIVIPIDELAPLLGNTSAMVNWFN